MSGIEKGQVEREEDMGVLGPQVTDEDLRRIQEKADIEVRQGEEARRDLYARMAANMVITEQPRGSYFVRNPGL